MELLTKEEATKFFTDFFCGEHHIPSDIESCGRGWSIKNNVSLSTTDYDGLTKLVIMAHDRCMRAEIMPCRGNAYRIALHKRTREEDIMVGHPTIEESIIRVRSYKTYSK